MGLPCRIPICLVAVASQQDTVGGQVGGGVGGRAKVDIATGDQDLTTGDGDRAGFSPVWGETLT